MNKLAKIPIVRAALWAAVMLAFPLLAGVMAGVFSMGEEDVLLLQGGFMLLSLVVPFTQLSKRGATAPQVGIVSPPKNSARGLLYYLPAGLAALLPAFAGIDLRGLGYLLALCFFCIAVAMAEELYFRGVIYNILTDAYPAQRAVLLSALVFCVAHSLLGLAFGRFAGADAVYALFQVLHALLLGVVAAELRALTGSLYPGIAWHTALNFVNHLSSAQGNALLVLCGAQAVVMAGYGWWLWRNLQNT